MSSQTATGRNAGFAYNPPPQTACVIRSEAVAKSRTDTACPTVIQSLTGMVIRMVMATRMDMATDTGMGTDRMVTEGMAVTGMEATATAIMDMGRMVTGTAMATEETGMVMGTTGMGITVKHQLSMTLSRAVGLRCRSRLSRPMGR